MEVIKNITIINPSGIEVKADCHEYTRGGIDSPILEIYYYNDRQLTPYVFKKEGWRLSLSGLFSKTYRGVLDKLIPSFTNPFLSMIRKDNNKGHRYHTPVILGVEHGVVFKDEDIVG